MSLPGYRALPHSSGEAVNRFRDDVQLIHDYLEDISNLLANGLLAVVGVVIMARISASLTFTVFMPLALINRGGPSTSGESFHAPGRRAARRRAR